MDLTNDVNDQMVESDFQLKGQSFAKNKQHRQICSLRVPHHIKIYTY